MNLRALFSVVVLSCITARAQVSLQTALDAGNLTWSTNGTGGGLGWIGQTNTSHDGISAAKALVITPYPSASTSSLITTVSGPGTLTFWWMGGAPDVDGSKLTFAIGSTTILTFPSYASWTKQTIYLGSGSQTLKWTYTQPGMLPGSYPGYVDQVSWTPGRTAPFITLSPVGQSVVPGLNATFYVAGDGTPPLSYQWQLNGTNITNATSSSYTVTNAQPENLGKYRVSIANSAGTNFSTEASLEFGEIAVWGYQTNADTRGTAPLGATNVQQISAGWQHNVLLRNDGTIVNWGDTNVCSLLNSGGVSNVLHSSALNSAGVILNSDHTVTVWGNTSITNVPANLTNVIALAHSPTASFCLALKADGTVVSWGSGAPASIPATVTNIVSIAAGQGHCLALRADGYPIAWGDNTFGQVKMPVPMLQAAVTNRLVAIAAGGYHSMALRADGTVFAWGYNVFGQSSVPGSAQGAMAISAGNDFSVALKTDGTVVAWGHNFFGGASVPPGLTNVVAISAGLYHCLALVASGPPASAMAANPLYSSNTFSLSLPSQCGKIFGLDYKATLADPNWTLLGLGAGTGTNVIISDLNATNSQGLYRVRRW